METQLVSLVKTDPAVNALIAGRFFPSRLPETMDLSADANFPSCLYTEVFDTEMVQVPVKITTVQITIYSKTYAAGKSVKTAIIDLLHRYKSGALRSAVYSNGVGPFKDSELDLWQTTLDFRFKHMEEV